MGSRTPVESGTTETRSHGGCRGWTLFVCLATLWGWTPAQAQAPVDGHVSLLFDVLPDISAAAGAQRATELRARLFVEHAQEVGEHLRINLAAYVDGLVGARPAAGESDRATDAIVRPGDLYVEYRAERFDVRAGFSRVVWGRLDEFQPTDVVNPIDLTRFLLEGRSEARLPVALVRGRLFLPGSSTLEAVVVPAFRPARFDQLDEATSPFNLAATPLPVQRSEPERRWNNLQGGARLTSTAGRVDWGATVYRGFRAFPTFTLQPGPLVRETFPRFTMVGGDFETARGPWGVRGELAVFTEDEFQSTAGARGVPGRSVEAGIGADRRAGDYRVAANVIVNHRSADDEEIDGTDVSIVGSADRTFARETRRLRVLGVYDPVDDTGFARIIAAISLRDNVWLEGSGGLFAGSALDTIGRLTRRDFVYARLKVFF